MDIKSLPLEMYSFKEISDYLMAAGYTWRSSDIERDFRRNILGKFLIHNQNTFTGPNIRKRIQRVIQILNKYAREHIAEGPYQIMAINDAEQVHINEKQIEYLTDNIESNSLFELWLKEYRLDINKIRIMIPKDEAIRYINYIIECAETSLVPECDSDNLAETEYENNSKCNLPVRSEDSVKPCRKKSALTLIIQHVLDSNAKGENVDIESWDSINKFLIRELARKAVLSDGNSIAYYVKKIGSVGSGIEMQNKIPGKKWCDSPNLYSHRSFKERFGKEKKKRSDIK